MQRSTGCPTGSLFFYFNVVTLIKAPFRMTSWIRITRPINVSIMFVSVAAIIGVIAPSRLLSLSSLWAALSTALIGGAANVINDVFDVDIDRINRPDRVLVQNSMSITQAKRWASLLFVVGFASSLPLGWINASIAFCAVVGLIGYSAYLKRTALWGNLTVSFFSALAFVYGGFAVNRPDAALFPAGFAFLIHLARELIKDMEDTQGDARQNAKTFPIVFGERPTVAVISAIFALLSGMMALAFVFGHYNLRFILIGAGGIYPILGWVLVKLWRRPAKNDLHAASTSLKWAMVVGLIAIVAGSNDFRTNL